MERGIDLNEQSGNKTSHLFHAGERHRHDQRLHPWWGCGDCRPVGKARHGEDRRVAVVDGEMIIRRYENHEQAAAGTETPRVSPMEVEWIQRWVSGGVVTWRSSLFIKGTLSGLNYRGLANEYTMKAIVDCNSFYAACERSSSLPATESP